MGEQQLESLVFEADTRAPKVVYTSAPLVLASLTHLEGDTIRGTVGGQSRALSLDPGVDPALIAESFARQQRVVIDTTVEPPAIVGVLSTQRALTIDREGNVDAEVQDFRVHARGEVVLKTASAFVRATASEVELYGERVVTRARTLAKILAAMIKLN